MYKKEDPRAIRTREMFKQAVRTLLQNGTSINNLTIQKVAQQAGLNRTTFYLHYQDIQQLLAQLTDEIIQQLTQKVEALIESPDFSEKTQLVQLLDYLYSQRHYLLILFQTEPFEQQLHLLMKRLIGARRENTVKSPTKKYVNAEIKAASVVGIMMWWLKNGLHYSSEYIAEEIHALYNKR